MQEIAQQTGLSEPDVLRQIDALIQSRDFLGRKAKRRLLQMELEEMYYSAAARVKDATDKNASGIYNAVRNAFEALVKEWDKQDAEERQDVDAIRDSYYRMFLSIHEKAAERLIGRLEGKYDIDGDAVREEFKSVVMEIAREADE